MKYFTDRRIGFLEVVFLISWMVFMCIVGFAIGKFIKPYIVSDTDSNNKYNLICKIDKQIDTVNNLILTCSEIGK